MRFLSIVNKVWISIGIVMSLLLCFSAGTCRAVKISLIYPETGLFHKEGKDMWKAAQLAISQINAAGGILGQSIELAYRDCNSNTSVAIQEALRVIEDEDAKMIFGAASSDVAIALSKLCEKKKIIFFAVSAKSTALTSTHAGRYTFRECNDNWMAANALKVYLNKHFSGKKYFYITVDNSWGWTIEAAVRKVSKTNNRKYHPGLIVPEKAKSYRDALLKAKSQKSDVLILSLDGKDMANAVRAAEKMGLKKKMQIIVPNLTIGSAELASPSAMEGIVGTVPWCWQIPYGFKYVRGIQFVEDFTTRFQRYPSSTAASIYTILHEYKYAVERAGSFESLRVVSALEGHTYRLLKDAQTWRKFDHQSKQTMYLVRCKPVEDVLRKKNLDYFETINSFLGDKTIQTRAQWNRIRKMAGAPLELK